MMSKHSAKPFLSTRPIFAQGKSFNVVSIDDSNWKGVRDVSWIIRSVTCQYN